MYLEFIGEAQRGGRGALLDSFILIIFGGVNHQGVTAKFIGQGLLEYRPIQSAEGYVFLGCLRV